MGPKRGKWIKPAKPLTNGMFGQVSKLGPVDSPVQTRYECSNGFLGTAKIGSRFGERARAPIDLRPFSHTRCRVSLLNERTLVTHSSALATATW